MNTTIRENTQKPIVPQQIGSDNYKGFHLTGEEKKFYIQQARLAEEASRPLLQLLENEEVRHFIATYQEALKKIEKEERFWGMQPRIKEKISEIGQYGWTALPGTQFESYLECPTDTQQETDDFFMRKLNDNTVQDLFSEIEAITDEPDDISEAILDYKDERYKSSAMILFALIDAILIKSNDNKLKGRKDIPQEWGNKFFLNIEKGIRFHDIHLVGITTSLNELFRSWEKFIYPEHIINRNVLDHGMLRRKVTKKDCLQIFLLYRNMVKLIIDIEDRFYSPSS